MMQNLPSIFKKIVLRRDSLLTLLFSFLTLVLFTAPVFAVETQTISANPTRSSISDPRSKSWFIYSLPAGVTKTDAVTVSNNGTGPITLEVYAADSTKTNDGGFALANEGVAAKELGSWVKLSTSEVTLGPKEKKDISFTISIPKDIPKGEYSGGILFQEAKPKKLTNNGLGINVISRIGVRIYETVSREDQLNLIVKDLKYSVLNNNLAFSFTIENKGTVFVSPTGTLEVRDMVGQVIGKMSLNDKLDVVRPGIPESLTIQTQIVPSVLGWNSASVVLYYSPTKAAVASIVFMSNPWPAFVIVFLLVLLVVYLLVRKKIVKYNLTTSTKKPSAKVLLTVGAILLGAVAFSYFVVYLLNLYFKI